MDVRTVGVEASAGTGNSISTLEAVLEFRNKSHQFWVFTEGVRNPVPEIKASGNKSYNTQHPVHVTDKYFRR